MNLEADPPGLSVSALGAFLEAAAPGMVAGPLRAELLSGGRSNLTYLITDGTSRWVLRRPPLGHVLATAHDMGREYRVLEALRSTDVPVPAPIVQAGPEVIGAPFYLMEYAVGDILRGQDQLEALGGTAAVGVAEELVDVLARLHRIDPAVVGLGDLGRPDGYLERQLARWARQLAASRSREVAGLAELGRRLAQSLPEGGTTAVVHGDYRLDNVVLEAGNGRVVAVLDWEMATLGDPLADLASTVVWWDGIRGMDSPIAAVPGDVPGFPAADTLIVEYERRTGRDLAQFPWYVGFAFYKIAAIFEGIHYRAEQGLTVGDGFDRLGPMVPTLVQRGHAALDSPHS